jgi:hypothetical protein
LFRSCFAHQTSATPMITPQVSPEDSRISSLYRTPRCRGVRLCTLVRHLSTVRRTPHDGANSAATGDATRLIFDVRSHGRGPTASLSGSSLVMHVGVQAEASRAPGAVAATTSRL